MDKTDHYLKTRRNVFDVQDAIVHLRTARNLLARASARKSTARVRLALTSAEGALRHAERKKSEFDRSGRVVDGRRFKETR